MNSISVTTRIPDFDVLELKQVINELARRVLTSGWGHLRTVEVIDDSLLEQHVRSLISQSDDYNGQSYTVPPHGPVGIAVPIKTGNELVCYIVLPKSNVLPPLRSATVVSLLLEELLHVETYSKHWEISGNLMPPFPAHLQDLAVVAMFLQDEYVVNRHKAQILGTEPLVEIDGVRQPFWLTTREPLDKHFDQSRKRLREIVRAIGSGQIQWPQSWSAIMNWLHRFVFSQLAYDAGYRTWRESPHNAISQASRSTFFRDDVRPFWTKILTQLERTYDSDLESIDQTTYEIVTILLSFLDYLGVHMDDTGYVTFEESLARWT